MRNLFYLLSLCFFLFSCSKSTADELVISETKVAEALKFCREQGMNREMCILINMGIHSGKKRLAVWDFDKNKAVYNCPVSHGCGDNPWSMDESRENPTFSNADGSHCTSLGKYRIGERGYSSWGVKTKYLLYGLESSNKNAMRRAIVFHSWEQIPEDDVYPRGSPEGWGCPAISNNSFRKIDPMLKNSSRPVLMWIYAE